GCVHGPRPPLVRGAPRWGGAQPGGAPGPGVALAPFLPDGRRHVAPRGLVPPVPAHGGAPPRQFADDSLPDSPRAPGDQGHLAFQPAHATLLSAPAVARRRGDIRAETARPPARGSVAPGWWGACASCPGAR